MKERVMSAGQRRRFEKIRELARRYGNVSLAPVESHLNPYRHIPLSRLMQVETAIRDAFMGALVESEVPVLLWADPRARSLFSLEFATKQNSRGNLLRILARREWFERNWGLFADDPGPEVHRDIFVFLKYDEASLSRLAAPWWDPNVLINPSITRSRSLLREVRARVEPGTIVFSLAMARLRSCEIFFHQSDLDVVAECVCANAHKQEWWSD